MAVSYKKLFKLLIDRDMKKKDFKEERTVNMPEEKRKTKTSTAVKSRYNAKTYDQIAFRTLKSDRLPELLDIAITQSNLSKNAYITSAIFEKLAKDGITLDMLPDASQDND